MKISTCPVANLVAETPQFARELVIIGVLGKLPGAQKFVVLESLPTILDLIESGIEHNTVRVQVRVEGTRRIVSEQGGNEVAGGTVVLCAACPNTSCRKCLEFPQGRLTARAWASRIRSSSPRKPARETDFGGEKVKS